ncbi:MAG: glycosyltransferase [Selenomonas ruminantium]|nr:glycosyltransferase [Selenomonas ruminantium]
MKKLAIISSYKESCGNATYTEALRKEFSRHFEVDVLGLNVKWLSSTGSRVRSMADKHIDEMAAKLKNYDYVNIQFEAGLYGSHPKDIIRRVKKLITAAPNLVFTMHRVDLKKSFWDKDVLKGFLSKRFMANLKDYWRQNYFPQVYSSLVDHIKEESRHKNIQIIVHTQRDEDNVRYMLGYDNVHSFPLSFLNKDELAYYEKVSSRSEFLKEYGLEEEDKAVGLFGFLGDYKGYETAISAMKLLPEEYHLLIFGSQHPMSIHAYEPVNPYIAKLMAIIEAEELDDRVHFVGGLDDEPFIKALHTVDFVVLPYLEVNQGGSGIASLTVETKAKSLFSNSLAFGELKRYFPNCFESFDIGNYHELAYKILNYHAEYGANIDKALEKYNIENNILFHKQLFEKGDS